MRFQICSSIWKNEKRSAPARTWAAARPNPFLPNPMSLTCPICKKPNQAGPVCQRCACDLSALHAIRHAAQVCLGRARRCLHNQQWIEALAEAERSWELVHSTQAARCAFVVAGAAGNTAAALRWRERAGAIEEPTSWEQWAESPSQAAWLQSWPTA
jgi:hypothetical protein